MLTREAIDGYLAACQASNLSPQTIAGYQRTLHRFADYYPALPTEPEPIEEFLALLQGCVGGETLHLYYQILKTFYRFLERRYRVWNPMSLIKAPRRKKKVVQTLSPAEQATLLAFADRSPRAQAILTLFLDSMIRVGELASLCQGKINGNTIIVEGKTGEREVCISDSTSQMLRELGDGNHVFMGERGPLTVSGIEKIVRCYLKLIGYRGEKLGPHLLRHTAATQFIENGGNPLVLQRILGHSTLEMTNRYVHLAAMKSIAKEHAQYTALQSLPPLYHIERR